MEIKIFQINLDRDTNRVAFADLEHTEKYQGGPEIDSSIYDEVFSGNVDCSNLEDVFQLFNLDCPDNYAGRSLSVSDIVQVLDSTSAAPGYYFCDTVGFKEVCFDPALASESRPMDSMRVVLLEPEKEARITEIGASLEDMQTVVGGYIEAVYPFREHVALVCNDEGKLLGLPLNRALRHEDTKEIYDIIAGTCFICDCSSENFGSLSSEQAQKYSKMFQNPELFCNLNGKIIAIPYSPKPESRTQEDRSR